MLESLNGTQGQRKDTERKIQGNRPNEWWTSVKNSVIEFPLFVFYCLYFNFQVLSHFLHLETRRTLREIYMNPPPWDGKVDKISLGNWQHEGKEGGRMRRQWGGKKGRKEECAIPPVYHAMVCK